LNFSLLPKTLSLAFFDQSLSANSHKKYPLPKATEIPFNTFCLVKNGFSDICFLRSSTQLNQIFLKNTSAQSLVSLSKIKSFNSNSEYLENSELDVNLSSQSVFIALCTISIGENFQLLIFCLVAN
jgi:hypothetical protein